MKNTDIIVKLPELSEHETLIESNSETIITENETGTTLYSKNYIASVCISFTISAMCAMLLNKQITTTFNYVALTLIIQNSFLLVLLKLWKQNTQFDIAAAIQWLPCAILFCCNIVTSMQSLQYLSVPTFTVLRNMQVIFTFPLDWVIRGKRLSLQSFFLIFIVFAGVCLYHLHRWHSTSRDYVGPQFT